MPTCISEACNTTPILLEVSWKYCNVFGAGTTPTHPLWSLKALHLSRKEFCFSFPSVLHYVRHNLIQRQPPHWTSPPFFLSHRGSKYSGFVLCYHFLIIIGQFPGRGGALDTSSGILWNFNQVLHVLQRQVHVTVEFGSIPMKKGWAWGFPFHHHPDSTASKPELLLFRLFLDSLLSSVSLLRLCHSCTGGLQVPSSSHAHWVHTKVRLWETWPSPGHSFFCILHRLPSGSEHNQSRQI